MTFWQKKKKNKVHHSGITEGVFQEASLNSKQDSLWGIIYIYKQNKVFVNW